MSSIFQPKRVQVPGLLSDDGLAVRIKELTSQQKALSEAAPPSTSAVEFADQVINLRPGEKAVNTQLQRGVNRAATKKRAEQTGTEIAQNVGGLPGVKQAAEAVTALGTLTPEQQEEEQAKLVEQAKREEEAQKATAAAAEAVSQDKQFLAQPMVPDPEAMRQLATEATEERELVESVKPTQTWWLNAAQVGTRSAAEMGLSALRFPVSVWELGAETVTGQAQPTDVGVWLDGVDVALTKMLPGDKARSKEFLTEVSAGFGSMTAFMIAGYAGVAVGLPAGVTSGVLGAAVTGNQLYEEAGEFDANATQKWMALLLGMGLGATEAIPIDRAFMRADAASGGLIRRMLSNTTATSMEEFIQEVGQTAGEDLIAKFVYDEERELDPVSWLRAGAVGAITGAAAGSVTTVLQAGGGVQETAVAKVDDVKLEAAVDEAINAAQQRFDDALGDEGADLLGLEGGVSLETEGGASTAPARVQAVSQRTEQARPEVSYDPVIRIADSAAAQVEQQQSDVPTRQESFRRYMRNRTFATRDEADRVLRYYIDKWNKGDVLGQPADQLSYDLIDTLLVRRGKGFAVSNRGLRAKPAFEASPEPIGKAPEAAWGARDMQDYRQDAREGEVVDELYVSLQSIPKAKLAGGRSGYDWSELERGGAIPPVTLRRNKNGSLSIVDGNHRIEFFREQQGFDSIPAYVIRADDDVAVEQAQALPVAPDIQAAVENIQLEPSEVLPLPDIEKGLTGPIESVVKAARAYATAVGIPHRRARSYVRVDKARAARIAQAYADMKHEPNDPAVLAAYKAMAEETIAQYQFVKATGIKIETIKEGQPDPYPNGPRDVLKDIAAGHIWYFPTDQGFGSSDFDASDNPLLEATDEVSDNGVPMVVNDLFRVVHDFFGHGLEGSGFGPRGEENAWQSHMRLYSASAVPAMTSETRGQNSWVNYGPHGDHNRANPRDTIYADQKSGLMPSWTWQEGVADSTAYDLDAPVEAPSEQFLEAFLAAKEANPHGAAVHAYGPAEYASMRTFLAPDGLSGFALKGEDIVSVFSHPASGGGRARKIIDTAVANGGRTLDCFDGKLTEIYSRLGFVVVRREGWNDEYRPEGWQDAWGKPDVVYMEYGGDVESMVGAEAVHAPLDVAGSGSGGKVKVRDVAQAFHDRHQLDYGRKLFPENSEEDFDLVVQQALADFAAHIDQPNSGVGWYSKDVDEALRLTAAVYPTLATDEGHRRLYLSFAGVFSNGATPEQAWSMSAEAFDMFLETGEIPTARAKGKWGVRDKANNQQLALLKYLVESEGSLEAAMDWLVTLHPKDDINAVMTDSGLYKAGRFTTKAAREGETFGALALGEKLGRYTLGLHGVELEADNTTVDLWYTRTYRRWTGRLFDTPISAEGIAGGVANDKEREAIFKVTAAVQEQYPQLTAGDVQAVLWFFEKRLYGEHGVKTSEGTNSSGARKLLKDREVAVPDRSSEERDEGRAARRAKAADQADPLVEFMTGTSSGRQPYSYEPTRPAAGVPTQPDSEPSDVRLTQIASNLVKALNLTARHGRLVAKDSKVMGEFHKRSGVIRLRTWTDLSTLAHEAGHALNDAMAAPLDAFVNANLRQINKIAHQLYAGDLTQASGETVRREGFAEFFRIYAMTPDFARQKWPQLAQDFEAVLEAEDPKVRVGLNAMAEGVAAWLQLPSQRLIENTIIDGRREQGINAAVKELKELGFKSWFQEFTRRQVQWSINRNASLNSLVSSILNQGEQNRGAPIELNRADDPRALIRLARNAGSRAMVQVTDGVIGYRATQSSTRGLREGIMMALEIDPETTPGALDEERLHKFSAYLVARRALEEYRRFDAGELDRPPVAYSKGDVIRAIREWEQEFPTFLDASEVIHEYGMGLWKKQYDAGLISKETYEDNLQRRFYVPLQRDLSDKRGQLGESAVTTRGSGPLQSVVKRFRGSDRDIIDPLAVLMQKTFALEALIAENEVKRTLAVLADRAGQVGALVERIPGHEIIGQQFGVGQVAKQLTGLDDMSEADAADLMTLLGASIKDGDTISLFRTRQAGAKGEPIIFFWEKGKVAALRLQDGDLGADVVNLMQSIGRENMDAILEGVAATSTVFRTAITSWPDFLLVNYIRDQFSAWILNDVGFVPFVSGIRGMIDEVRQKTWAKSYNAAQGIMGGMNVAALHKASVDRDIRALRSKGYIAQVFGDVSSGWDFPNMVRGLGRLTALSETGTRLGLYRGAYDRAKREGLTDYEASVEAAYLATDYIDFGLNGNKMLTSRRLIPFLNAQLQGLYKMVRALGGDEVAQRRGLRFALAAYFKNINNLPLSRLEKQQLRTGRKAWLKMLAIGAISAALHFIFKDDEDYQEAGEYLRTTGWVIPTGDGRIFYIPKPFELAMAANAIERGLEFATGDSAAPGRFMRGVAFSLTPPTAPPAIQTWVEASYNIDFFTGREIVPSYMQALEPELQYDHYTSSLARWTGDTFGLSPMMVDHVLGGMGASAYRDVSTMLNAVDPTRPSLDETDAPILRRFVRDVRRGSVSAQDFWNQASSRNGALARAAASYKREIELGNEPAAQRRLQSMTADERAYAVLMTHYKAEDKRLNPFYRASQVTTLVSGMRREVSSALSLEDTAVPQVPGQIPLTAAQKQQVDELLSELARREVRNTLIATGQPGWAEKRILPIEPTLDLLLQASPDVYDELQRRWAKRKIYDDEVVYESWPDIRDRLVQDGEFAILSDVRAVASAGL